VVVVVFQHFQQLHLLAEAEVHTLHHLLLEQMVDLEVVVMVVIVL
jgi:hypothetical protein